MTKEQADELRAFIAVAEACWRGSPSWHVLDWMSHRMRLRYPLVIRRNPIINMDVTT